MFWARHIFTVFVPFMVLVGLSWTILAALHREHRRSLTSALVLSVGRRSPSAHKTDLHIVSAFIYLEYRKSSKVEPKRRQESSSDMSRPSAAS